MSTNENQFEFNGSNLVPPGPLVRMEDTNTSRTLPKPANDDPADCSGDHSALSSTSLPRIGEVLVGQYARYELTEVLGSGGMGSVYAAICTGVSNETAEPLLADGTTVAVKIFHDDSSGAVTILLQRELSALRALKHERIPRVLDWNMEVDKPFVTFPLFRCGSLADHIVKNGPLAEEQVWQLLQDVLSAANSAHVACLHHLDIKPANVLMDESGCFMLTDFGISQSNFVTQYGITTGLGTPDYQAPEQRSYRKHQLDARTDLWGAGITAWAALTGVVGPTLHKLRLQSRTQPCGLPPPSQLSIPCSPQLADCIMALLIQEPNERPGSAAEVLAYVASRGAANPLPCTNATSRDVLSELSHDELRLTVASYLLDPVWRSIISAPQLDGHLVQFGNNQLIIAEGEQSYHAFILLSGSVEIRRGNQCLMIEDREGTFLGEVTALVGVRRTASIYSRDDTTLLSLNAAQFELFIAQNPAIALRLIKTLAERVHRESQPRIEVPDPVSFQAEKAASE
jgi:serine/threonine protein kinase